MIGRLNHVAIAVPDLAAAAARAEIGARTHAPLDQPLGFEPIQRMPEGDAGYAEFGRKRRLAGKAHAGAEFAARNPVTQGEIGTTGAAEAGAKVPLVAFGRRNHAACPFPNRFNGLNSG